MSFIHISGRVVFVPSVARGFVRRVRIRRLRRGIRRIFDTPLTSSSRDFAPGAGAVSELWSEILLSLRKGCRVSGSPVTPHPGGYYIGFPAGSKEKSFPSALPGFRTISGIFFLLPGELLPKRGLFSLFHGASSHPGPGIRDGFSDGIPLLNDTRCTQSAKPLPLRG